MLYHPQSNVQDKNCVKKFKQALKKNMVCKMYAQLRNYFKVAQNATEDGQTSNSQHMAWKINDGPTTPRHKNASMVPSLCVTFVFEDRKKFCKN
jgi:hypothetical protein